MRQIIQDIFGTYTPIEVLIEDGLDVDVYQAVADWEWLAGVFLFSLVLYSMFRILGSMFGGRK